MRRVLNQINVSITTNRGCNLRCEHCYIMPHVFKDPSRMTMETFKLLFDRVEELAALDKNLEEIEWEAIGGETTLMPFEWWEEALPYALGRIERINKGLAIPGSLNFLTNMMIRDERYFDLFNRYATHPAFAIYTSWEPDTKRFGARNKLFPKFLANLDRLKVPSLTMDVIMTKEVIALGGKWVVDTFVPHGVTDFSCKMLSPYGSGKAFFETAMVDFASMTRFLEELRAALPPGVTYTPGEEALSSLYRGTSFQCNGNFYYDLSVEPDGLTHFNANQTAEEAAVGGMEIRLEDPNWARKVLYENTTEAFGKLSLEHKACDQCTYLPYCNAGWWHYKVDQPLIAPFLADECPGLKGHWDARRAELQGSVFPEEARARKAAAKAALRPAAVAPLAWVRESAAVSPESWSVERDPQTGVVLDTWRLFGKGLGERMVFYDGLGVATRWDPDLWRAIPTEEEAMVASVVEAQVYGTWKRSAPVPSAGVWELVARHPSWRISGRLLDADAAWRGRRGGLGKGGTLGAWNPASGLIVDDRHDPLFRWVAANPAPTGMWVDAGALDATPSAYLVRLESSLEQEARMRARVAQGRAA
jgi:hypothetical protein